MRVNASRPVLLLGLGIKLALSLILGVGCLSLFLIWYSGRELSASAADAGRAQSLAIARSFEARFQAASVERPRELQSVLEHLRKLNPELRKATIYRLQRGEGVRVASTDRSQLGAPVEQHDIGPITSGRLVYKEEREHGTHLAELNFPLREQGARRSSASLGLYLDLAPLDAALASRERRLLLAAVSTGLLLVLLGILLLKRTVLGPLDQLRSAARAIRDGHADIRLEWSRGDELGMLAEDFDEMARELDESHARLESLALTDPLTGLLNHRAFQERLGSELERASREDYPVAVVAIDVDHFKEINGCLGHASGDEALRLLAQTLRSVVRPTDLAGRVGGDEFMLALIGVDAARAEQVVVRLRSKLASSRLSSGSGVLTLSIGISEFPRHTVDKAELMRLADGAMYWSKRSGRDRHSLYSPEIAAALSPQEDITQIRESSLLSTIHGLAGAVDAKDGYTHQHCQRVALYAGTLARSLGLDDARVELIKTAGVLHDVGKIGVPDAVLLKPGKLTAQEFTQMQRHSTLGRDIIAGAGMSEVAEWVLHLHERYDGHGYPDGLQGEAIPLESRILHAADTLEAMTSARVYRPAMSLKDALFELEANAGTQLDFDVATRLAQLVRRGDLRIELHTSSAAPAISLAPEGGAVDRTSFA